MPAFSFDASYPPSRAGAWERGKRSDDNLTPARLAVYLRSIKKTPKVPTENSGIPIRRRRKTQYNSNRSPAKAAIAAMTPATKPQTDPFGFLGKVGHALLECEHEAR